MTDIQTLKFELQNEQYELQELLCKNVLIPDLDERLAHIEQLEEKIQAAEREEQNE